MCALFHYDQCYIYVSRINKAYYYIIIIILGFLVGFLVISDLNLPLRVHKYMDDTTISEAISTSEDSVMQNTANSVLEWSNKNNMKINAKKTKEMIINFSNTPLNLAPLKIDDCELECVTEFKLLGVWLQSNLSWDEHVTSNHLFSAKLLNGFISLNN